MANLVSFQSFTAAEYEALSGEYVDNRIYFLSDTGELKLNGVDYGRSKQEEEPDYLTVDIQCINVNSIPLAIPNGWNFDLEYSVNNGDWVKIPANDSGSNRTYYFPGTGTVRFRGDNPDGTFKDGIRMLTLGSGNTNYTFNVRGNPKTLIAKNRKSRHFAERSFCAIVL